MIGVVQYSFVEKNRSSHFGFVSTSLGFKFSAWQPGAKVEGFDDARKATRIEKSEQSSPSKESKIGYPDTELVRGARARA